VQIAYATVTQGYESFVVHEETMEARIASGELASYLRRNGGEFRVYRWAVANAPAIRSEAFITTTKDYRDRVDIQLTGYALSGGGSRNVLSDWGELVDQLAESPSFAGKIDATSAVRTLAASLTAGCASSEDTVRALYNWVDTSLVHNDEGLTMSGDVDDVLGSKRASSLESTVLFLSLLKAVGKTGDIVLYSSRTHGEIQKLQPLISQFDEVLARVAVGPGTMDLSPTDPLRPMDLLPVEALNREGLVIRAKTLLWMPMTSDRRSVRNVLASVRIHEDGTSEGWLEGESSDYAAVRFRRWAEARKDHARALEFFGLEEREATVDSIIIEHLPDMSVPVRVRAHATGFSGITKIGDRIYVTPMLADRVKENPLTLEKRKFPVDFAYPWLQMVTVKLELPTGFVVSDTLANRSHSAVNGTGIYTRRLRIDSARVEMASRFEVLKSKFDPRSYAELREFYGAVVGAQGEQFAIEKRVIPPPPPERTKPEKPAKRVKR
jgi:hypothetical protein